MPRKSAGTLSLLPGETDVSLSSPRHVRAPIRLSTPSKYHAVRTTIDNISFASKREARRYEELKILLRAGVITDLQLQPAFPVIVERVTVATYRADFCYRERGQVIVEDCKGFRTPVYRLKKKLVEAQYKITIRET
jgi:hypothetical protein